MKRLTRFALDVLAGASLMLFLAMFSLWVRSNYVQDSVTRAGSDGETQVAISMGIVRVYTQAPGGFWLGLPANVVPTIFRHETRAPQAFKEPMYPGERVTFDHLGIVVWNVSKTAGVPRTSGANVPCWMLAVLFALLPACWWISLRRRRQGLSNTNGD
jgi:hypothetical protein